MENGEYASAEQHALHRLLQHYPGIDHSENKIRCIVGALPHGLETPTSEESAADGGTLESLGNESKERIRQLLRADDLATARNEILQKREELGDSFGEWLSRSAERLSLAACALKRTSGL